MKRVSSICALAVAVVCLTASPLMARGWYIGGGIEAVSFGEDLSDVDSGGGFGFSFGYKFSPLFALDFLWGGSVHDENYAGGQAAQGNFLAGAKFSFNDPNSFQPFLTAGISGHSVDFDYFDKIDGSGVFLGFGTDIYITPNHAIDIAFRSSSWNGEDSVYNYDVKTNIFSVVYNYHFLQ